jgi:hypothetical protein
VTCRACHNALHDVGILDCVKCHQTPPGGHTSIYSNYANYLATTYKDCLRCHNDPHYEPERAAGGDCADCHLSGGMNATGGLPIIDWSGFNASVHRNITGDFDASNNTAIGMVCWGCHNNYTEQLEDPKHFRIKPNCTDCHFNETPLNIDYLPRPPRQAVEHQPDGTDVITLDANCTTCHNKSLVNVSGVPPTADVNNPNARNFVSHYGRQRTDIIVDGGAASDCAYCHRDGGNEFNNVFADKTRANVTHDEGFDVNCTDCHGYGRIHDEELSAPSMVGGNSRCMDRACHGNPLKPWFIDISAFDSGIHGGANCTDCHTPLQPIDDIRGSVSTGEPEPRCYSFEVPEKINNVTVKQINVTLDWVSGSLDLTLNASGVEINPSVAETNPNIKCTVNETFISYLITNPINGTWEACVSGADTTTRFDLGVEFIFGHPKHGECYTNPCYLCHVTNISYNAPPVAEHVTNSTKYDAVVWTEASCTDCHRNDIVYSQRILDANVSTDNTDAMTAHYGVPEVLDTRDCISCHENDDTGRKWGDAPDPRNVTRYERIEDANDIEETLRTANDIEETLRTGEVCKLKNGYEITVGPVSSTGSSVWVDLAHNGVSVQRELVSEGGVFEYEIKKDWIKSKSNAGDDLYGTGHETYKHRRSDESGYTTIVDLEVDDIFTSGMMGVVTFKGLVLKSRMHVETDDKACYTCHIDEYRYYAPDDGDGYFVLRNTGADGDTDDADDITIGRLVINFTEHAADHRDRSCGQEGDGGTLEGWYGPPA